MYILALNVLRSTCDLAALEYQNGGDFQNCALIEILGRELNGDVSRYLAIVQRKNLRSTAVLYLIDFLAHLLVAIAAGESESNNCKSQSYLCKIFHSEC